ncbi:MAG: TA system VapC family ribonuclease toxin, partial [Chloroflexota bacterium]
MSSLIFLDINVWLALSQGNHVHHEVAARWLDRFQASDRIFFCRHTQIGLLRLLSVDAVMGVGKALNQAEAWRAYDRWLADERVEFHDEPEKLEGGFRKRARSDLPAPKAWADAYLEA